MSGKVKSPVGWFEFGLDGPLHIREERLSLRSDARRLIYVSDIHLRPGRSRSLSRQVLESVRAGQADAVLLGGDLVDAASELEPLADLVGGLREIAPVLAVAGNHDVAVGLDRVRDAVRRGGGEWIHERTILLTLGSRVISVAGPASVATSGGDVRVLCAHNPRVWKRSRQGYDLVLAGHLHGCQVVAFEYRDRLFPGAWFYPYCYLSHQSGPARLVVSRGVSDLIPFRWRCPREVVLCHV